MSDTISVTTLAEAPTGVRCDCGYSIPILPPDKSWRKVLCTCGEIWWVKPSGRRFERNSKHKEFEY